MPGHYRLQCCSRGRSATVGSCVAWSRGRGVEPHCSLWMLCGYILASSSCNPVPSTFQYVHLPDRSAARASCSMRLSTCLMGRIHAISSTSINMNSCRITPTRSDIAAVVLSVLPASIGTPAGYATTSKAAFTAHIAACHRLHGAALFDIAPTPSCQQVLTVNT